MSLWDRFHEICGFCATSTFPPFGHRIVPSLLWRLALLPQNDIFVELFSKISHLLLPRKQAWALGSLNASFYLLLFYFLRFSSNVTCSCCNSYYPYPTHSPSPVILPVPTCSCHLYPGKPRDNPTVCTVQGTLDAGDCVILLFICRGVNSHHSPQALEWQCVPQQPPQALLTPSTAGCSGMHQSLVPNPPCYPPFQDLHETLG